MTWTPVRLSLLYDPIYTAEWRQAFSGVLRGITVSL